MATKYNDIVTLRSMRPAYNIKNEGPDDWKTFIANDQFNDLLKKPCWCSIKTSSL